jgi:DNA-binding response OmpR family regulator
MIWCVLATNPGKALTYRMLFNALRETKRIPSAHYIRVYINTTRKKLHDNLDGVPHYILTEPGVGYRFVDY